MTDPRLDPAVLQPGAWTAVPHQSTARLAELLRQSPLSALELFHPKLIQRLTLLWGSAQLDSFFSQVMLDQTMVTTTPLNGAEIDELMTLAAIHREPDPGQSTAWDQARVI